jgi:hypothetical protein
VNHSGTGKDVSTNQLSKTGRQVNVLRLPDFRCALRGVWMVSQASTASHMVGSWRSVRVCTSFRKSPADLARHVSRPLEDIRTTVKGVQETLIDFLSAGLITTAFAPLDFVMFSTIPWHWATWLVLALEANLVVSLWSCGTFQIRTLFICGR